jgi:hypothetical protein
MRGLKFALTTLLVSSLLAGPALAAANGPQQQQKKPQSTTRVVRPNTPPKGKDANVLTIHPTTKKGGSSSSWSSSRGSLFGDQTGSKGGRRQSLF